MSIQLYRVDHDDVCHICKSLLFEPVTLPCGDELCRKCLDGNNDSCSFQCPFCRLRISVWLRSQIKLNPTLINPDRHQELLNKYAEFYEMKSRNEDLDVIFEENPDIRLANPGEISKEYKEQLEQEVNVRAHEDEKQELESLRFIYGQLDQDEVTYNELLELKRRQEEDDAELARILAGEIESPPLPLRPKRARLDTRYDRPSTTDSATDCLTGGETTVGNAKLLESGPAHLVESKSDSLTSEQGHVFTTDE
ncbi:putative ligase protein [Halotydeus destructor]|nr:putative ligase protein [Halotydeus destructor]